MGQAVLEQRHLISDSLSVSRFDHAWTKINYLAISFEIVAQNLKIKIANLWDSTCDRDDGSDS